MKALHYETVGGWRCFFCVQRFDNEPALMRHTREEHEMQFGRTPPTLTELLRAERSLQRDILSAGSAKEQAR